MNMPAIPFKIYMLGELNRFCQWALKHILEGGFREHYSSHYVINRDIMIVFISATSVQSEVPWQHLANSTFNCTYCSLRVWQVKPALRLHDALHLLTTDDGIAKIMPSACTNLHKPVCALSVPWPFAQSNVCMLLYPTGMCVVYLHRCTPIPRGRCSENAVRQ